MVPLHTACSYIRTCECKHSHFWLRSQLAGLPKNFPEEGEEIGMKNRVKREGRRGREREREGEEKGAGEEDEREDRERE